MNKLIRKDVSKNYITILRYNGEYIRREIFETNEKGEIVYGRTKKN